MQTPISRPGPLDVPKKSSPAIPRIAPKLKTPGSDSASASVSSPNTVSKTPKNRSPKVVDRRSPRTLATEKKRPNKVSELETQIAQLQEELKKAKDHLITSESWKRRAQQEAEEAKKQLAAMSAELEETEKQLKELSESEEARVQELRKISHDRDRAWQYELEAVRKQHSMDSTALSSAMNEMQKLKIQLGRVSQSEDSQARHAESAHAEIQSLRLELTETLVLVQKLKDKLNNSTENEAEALEEASRAQMQLEVVKTAEKTLQLEHADLTGSYNSLLQKFEQSKKKVSSLENHVSNLQTELGSCSKMSAYPSGEVKTSTENGDHDESETLKIELNILKAEVKQLRSALEDSERRYHDEYIESTLQIRNAYELVEHAKSRSCQREAELDAKLKESMAEVEELRKMFIEKENALQIFSFEKKELNLKLEENQTVQRETEHDLKLHNSESVLEDLKASLLDKEAQMQSIREENEKMKYEIMKTETERSKANDDALALLESPRATEQETLTKLGTLTEETDKNCKKVERVTEQLDAAQASNSELEAELRILKVQCDQWRKAAEAAAAMLSTVNNGKYVERTGSLDYVTIGKMLSSPHSEDTDDDSPKKKNGNMLKKIGVLLKKGQK